jgi:hypothetical protein
MGELNKLFGRDFVIGFFVPASIFVAMSAAMLRAFEKLPLWLRVDPTDPLKDTTFLALVTLAAAFFLMAGNRLLFRVLEGYWPFDLGRRLNYFQRRRFRKLHSRIRELTAERDECRVQNREFTEKHERNRLVLLAAQRFPSKESLVLSTSFGNAVRAFEDYPRIMYGFESINGWSRLNAVMPKSYQDTLGNMRSMTDFWVNLWFLSLLFATEWLLVAYRVRPGRTSLYIPFAGICVALFASVQARVAAEQWGEWVKAGFDIYLPLLCEKWGFVHPQNMEAERQLWQGLSRAIVFRNPSALDALEPLRQTDLQCKQTHSMAPEGETEPVKD